MIFQYLVCSFFAKGSSAVLFAVIYTIIIITLVFKRRR